MIVVGSKSIVETTVDSSDNTVVAIPLTVVTSEVTLVATGTYANVSCTVVSRKLSVASTRLWEFAPAPATSTVSVVAGITVLKVLKAL